jgi:hypothetical protein
MIYDAIANAALYRGLEPRFAAALPAVWRRTV